MLDKDRCATNALPAEWKLSKASVRIGGYAEAGQWEEALKWSQKALDTAEEDDENRPQLLKELES